MEALSGYTLFFLIGLIPIIIGSSKQKFGFAIGGFFACAVSGFILGSLLENCRLWHFYCIH